MTIILDRTFCSGLRCNRTNECDRYSKHPLVREAFKRSGRMHISMAQFADHDGKCSKFSPFETSGDGPTDDDLKLQKQKAQAVKPEPSASA